METAKLANPAATRRTQALYGLLRSFSGKAVLLGQQEAPRSVFQDREIEWIEAVSGETPAVRGLDFIHDDFAGVVERALRWNDRGGIVTVCWHTGIAGNDYLASKEETPDWEKLLVKALFRLNNAELDAIAEQYYENLFLVSYQVLLVNYYILLLFLFY